MKISLPRFASLLFIVVVSALASGCRTPKIDLDSRGVPAARVPRGVEDGTFALTEAPIGQWGDVGAPLDEIPGLGADGLAANERRWEGVVVYFAYDRSTIGVSEQHKVEALANHLRSNPNYYVIIEGHCDERGSDEYNRALGERRALAVHDFLVTLGIDASRIRTLSYGEERPVVANATSEEQHARNRRAEFIIGIGR